MVFPKQNLPPCSLPVPPCNTSKQTADRAGTLADFSPLFQIRNGSIGQNTCFTALTLKRGKLQYHE